MKLNFPQTVLLLFTLAMIIGCVTSRPTDAELQVWAKDWCAEHKGLKYFYYSKDRFQITCNDTSFVRSEGDLKELIKNDE